MSNIYPLIGKTHPACKYTEELAEKILFHLENGWSLNKICKDFKEEGMPHPSTIRTWVRNIPEFAEKYHLARKNQLEYWADEMIDLSDDSSQDILPDGKPNSAKVNRDRLAVDTRKFLLVHLMPEKFGQKVTQEVVGPNGGPVQTTEVPKEELARWLAFKLSSDKETK